MKILTFDIEKYKFQELVQSLFDRNLADLDNQEEKTNLT